MKMLSPDSTYMKMIKSKEYVPFKGQILFMKDGSYACLDEDCNVLDEPVSLKKQFGDILYSFDSDGEIMTMTHIPSLLNAGF